MSSYLIVRIISSASRASTSRYKLSSKQVLISPNNIKLCSKPLLTSNEKVNAQGNQNCSDHLLKSNLTMRQVQESFLWQFSERLGDLVLFHEAPRLACNVYSALRDTCIQMSACLQCRCWGRHCHRTGRPRIPSPGPRCSLSCNIASSFSENEWLKLQLSRVDFSVIKERRAGVCPLIGDCAIISAMEVSVLKRWVKIMVMTMLMIMNKPQNHHWTQESSGCHIHWRYLRGQETQWTSRTWTCHGHRDIEHPSGRKPSGTPLRWVNSL